MTFTLRNSRERSIAPGESVDSQEKLTSGVRIYIYIYIRRVNTFDVREREVYERFVSPATYASTGQVPGKLNLRESCNGAKLKLNPRRGTLKNSTCSKNQSLPRKPNTTNLLRTELTRVNCTTPRDILITSRIDHRRRLLSKPWRCRGL